MNDIVALRVRTSTRDTYGFMTWGRIVDSVDDAWLRSELLLKHIGAFQLQGDVDSIHVCESLQEVASCKYFFEALFHFASEGIPFGPEYEDWHRQRLEEWNRGSPHLYLLGAVRRDTPSPSAADLLEGR